MVAIIYSNPIDKRIRSDILARSDLTRACVPIDRTNVGNRFPCIYTPIPSDYNTNLTFEECMMLKAEEIWSYGKPVIMFWSGGLDSTAMYYALRETQKNELIVRGNNHSVEEYPKFIEMVNCHIVQDTDLIDRELIENRDYIKVTGDCGDQLFGCKTGLSYNQTDPWEVLIDKWSVEKFNFWSEQIEHSPIPIETILDLYWWANFTMEYTPYDFVMTCCFGKTFSYDTTFAFYHSDDFQKWSITNHYSKYNGWKMPIRDMIAKYGDSDYAYNKGKRSSLIGGIHHEYKFDKDAIALIDTNGTMLRRHDNLKEYLNENFASYV